MAFREAEVEMVLNVVEQYNFEYLDWDGDTDITIEYIGGDLDYVPQDEFDTYSDFYDYGYEQQGIVCQDFDNIKNDLKNKNIVIDVDLIWNDEDYPCVWVVKR